VSKNSFVLLFHDQKSKELDMDKKTAEFIQEQMSPQNQANRMKEGRRSIVDEISREIDLTEHPRHPTNITLTTRKVDC
jgi:hypothetical protein